MWKIVIYSRSGPNDVIDSKFLTPSEIIILVGNCEFCIADKWSGFFIGLAAHNPIFTNVFVYDKKLVRVHSALMRELFAVTSISKPTVFLPSWWAAYNLANTSVAWKKKNIAKFDAHVLTVNEYDI